MHHVYAAKRLEAAYLAHKRGAGPGVDGQPRTHQRQNLQGNLRDPSAHLARGSYHAKPVRRVNSGKSDGTKRPLGVPALEDKIGQPASVEFLNAICEHEFIGSSYGVWPCNGGHDALNAVTVGIGARRLNWVLDANISKFFDAIEHDWLVGFGRFARNKRRHMGKRKPDTFDFTGLAHCCGKTRKGKFMVLRIPSATRLRAKLLAVKTGL